MGRNVKRGVYQQATFAIGILQRPLDDFRQEGPDCLLWPVARLEAGDALAHRAVGVSFEGLVNRARLSP
jgi:hypothetical protein